MNEAAGNRIRTKAELRERIRAKQGTYRHLSPRGTRVRADGKEVSDDTWHLHGMAEHNHAGGQHRHTHS